MAQYKHSQFLKHNTNDLRLVAPTRSTHAVFRHLSLCCLRQRGRFRVQ